MSAHNNWIERVQAAQHVHEFFSIVEGVGAVDPTSLFLLNSLAVNPDSEALKGGLRKHLMPRAKRLTLKPTAYGVPIRNFGHGEIALGRICGTRMNYSLKGPDSLLKNFFVTGTTGAGKTFFACLLISLILEQTDE